VGASSTDRPDGEPFAFETPTGAEPIRTIEQTCLNGDGEARWVLWVYRGLFDGEGALDAVQAVGHDITERRDAEQGVLAANRKLQDVLDSMKEGLLVCDRSGGLGPIRSRAIMTWFGAPVGGARVWDFLFPDDSAEKLVFRLAFEQIAEDVLPFEVSVEQLPRTIVRGDTTYGLTCQPVTRDGRFAEIVITIQDVTRELEQVRIERRNREQSTLVGHLLGDRDGFRELLTGTSQLLGELAETPEGGGRMRLLHTLKGNTATYGLESFAARCHELEDLVTDGEAEATTAGIAALTREWQAVTGGLAAFLSDDENAGVRLAPFHYQDLVQRLERGDDSAETLRAVHQWLRPMMAQVLGMHARTVRQVAGRLGKEIETRIIDNGLRLTSDEMRPFLGMLGHLVRNAADHGIESPGERERAGKPRIGQITIESRLEGPELVIAIEDDGRGIDWDAVRAQAERRALPAADGDDLVEALFFDGLSTRRMATEISGRGIGLGAVREACRQLGGTVRVASWVGRGTRIEFRFLSPQPPTAAAPAPPRFGSAH
jgi:two-component system chemotaxis sensor kinase CheA